MRLESAVSSLVHEQHERELLEQALTQHDTRIRAVNKLGELQFHYHAVKILSLP